MTPFWKDIFREIKNTKGRFVSMLLITMLGAMLVVGIRATAINMRYAAHRVYRRDFLYDLQIRSPWGFTPSDVMAIHNLPGVSTWVMPTRIVDVYLEVQGTTRAMRTYTMPAGVNSVQIVEGRQPASGNEIVVERRLTRGGRFSIGDTITLHQPEIPHGEHTDTASVTQLAYNLFEIVGVVESPLYITGDRGNTSLGAGTIHYYAYLHADAYTLPFDQGFTDIYVVMEASRLMEHQVSEEYNVAALEWRREMEAALEELGIRGFVFTRQNGIAFESYFQDTLRLDQVGRVFPVVFFLVAILVALTAMSRMVDEQRIQIGIYKALGYSPLAVIAKYAFYAFACGLVGGIMGAVLGSQLIPRVIFDAYENLYNMPHSHHPVPWGISLVTVGIAIACILGTALITCINALTGEAAALMRPKAPKAGKRVLLESMPFIWRRMGFISKVTARNILRYKRRFFMSITGVAGCTALVLTGFGLRDSIGNVARMQYENIIAYDLHVHLRDMSEKDEITALIRGETLFIRTITANAYTEAGGLSATVIIPEDFHEMRDFIRPLPPSRGILSRNNNARVYPEGDGVFVTDKLAEIMAIAVGDYFTITMGGGAFQVRAAGIVENYVQHFIYMPPAYYAHLFHRQPAFNGILAIGSGDIPGLLEHDTVLGIANTAMIRDNLTLQTDALGIVTFVILTMACILAFVVLYNLTEINIIERMREIATVKVLGFYDMETAMYLYRENMVVTIIGIFLGLLGGIFLNSYLLNTMEIDMLKFPHIITPASYVLAAALSLLFALCVNAATYRRLIAIDMVAALKSVE